MPEKKLAKMVEIAAHDKRAIAGELAAALIIVYRLKMIQDPGMNRSMLNFHERIDAAKAKGSNWWLDLHGATVLPLSEKLELARETDEYERLMSLKEKLEQKTGKAVEGAKLMIRGFNLGDTLRDPKDGSLEISGDVKSLYIVSEDGSIVSVEDVQSTYATEEPLNDSLVSDLESITTPLVVGEAGN